MPTLRSRKRKIVEVEADAESPPTGNLRHSKKINYAIDNSDDEQPVRTSRILTINRIKKNDQAASNSNLQNSRLLSLPAEIRNRILKLVLGGQTIHIWAESAKQSRKTLAEAVFEDSQLDIEDLVFDSDAEEEDDFACYDDDDDDDDDDRDCIGESGEADVDDEADDAWVALADKKHKKQQSFRLRHSVCVCTPSDIEDIAQIKAEDASVRDEEHPAWRRRHRRWRHAYHKGLRPLKSLDLALLSVCRQLHGEVALLPFQENGFCIRDFATLATFLARLIPSQLHAVQHITMPYDYDKMDRERPNIEAQLKTSLRSLESLTIILDCTSYDDDQLSDYREDVFEDLMQFRKLELEGSVTVQVRNTQSPGYPGDISVLPDLERSAANLEEMLKKDWNVKNKKQLGELRKEARMKLGFHDRWM